MSDLEPMTEVAIDELAAQLGAVSLLDVRTRGEFEGTAGNRCDPRQGHIPGARNVDIHRLMQLGREQIEAALDIGDGGRVIAYCHSGSRSEIATQMLRALGYDARNYVGSWHEWSRRVDLPIET